jgi:hypothetical protein
MCWSGICNVFNKKHLGVKNSHLQFKNIGFCKDAEIRNLKATHSQNVFSIKNSS